MKKCHALSIGINEYQEFMTLGLCVDDSKAISISIKERFPESTTFILNDEYCLPTKNAILECLQDVESLGYDQNDVVIVFFAGHGFSIDGKDYITAHDTSLEDVSSAVSTDEVIDYLKKSGAGNAILIIDACRSEVDRGVRNFGERTAELSRRAGVVTFFGCSPGQTAKELFLLNGGVFSKCFSELLSDVHVPFTPFEFNQRLIRNIEIICKKHKLGKQTPYTAVAPLEKATFDPFTDLRHDVDAQKKELILVLGPSNAGKTTIGQFLAQEHGYIHAEMSSYAWRRFNDSKGYKGSILDFMENEVWADGNEDAIARDLIDSNISEGKLVVCGARRMEEIETILAQGWEVKPVYIFANASQRFTRIQHSSGRYGPSYEEFIIKDLKELSWGIAHMAQIKNIELLLNEDDLENCIQKLTSVIDK